MKHRAPIEIEQNGIILSFIITFNATNTELSVDDRIIYLDDSTYPIPSNVLYAKAFTGLEEGVLYNITVTAVSSIGAGLPSEDVIMVITPVVSPPNAIPFQVNETSVLSQTSASFTIILPDVSIEFLGGELTGFTITLQGFLTPGNVFLTQITRREITIISTTDIITVITGPGNEFMLTGLQPHFEYFVNVSANNLMGTTAAVQLQINPLDSDLPNSPPINIQSSTISSSAISYSWDKNLTTINVYLMSYNLYYAKIGQPDTLMEFPVNTLGPYTFILSNLYPNTNYSFALAVVNEIGEGPISNEIWETTFPTAPESTDRPLPVTPPPSTETGGRYELRIPSQGLFPTANIALIYIISDTNSPLVFTTLSIQQAYSLITSSILDVFSMTGISDIKIQAVLDNTYFSEDESYFLFLVGDNTETEINGNIYVNHPLQSDLTYELSYYILFYDENGQTSPAFATMGASANYFRASTADPTCVACIVIPLIIFVIIIAVILVTIIFVWYWFIQRKTINSTVDNKSSPVEGIILTRIGNTTINKEEEHIYSNKNEEDKLDNLGEYYMDINGIGSIAV
ncbi:hypothetical protein LOD99_10029 [Oopsacas minuta]|uniref:Fibronectin type-III domain-containing protein n=1 Tax=Oopsacas minuta TaxID=111878 RepID=A0AAV7KK11_9METZ|nr:hypothetical protein LOD99_10029 [Oopsacas minuta]